MPAYSSPQSHRGYPTSTNASYPEIPQEVINYLRMVPIVDSNVTVWKKGLGGLRKESPIIVPQHIRGDSAIIHFSIAGNCALVGNTWINIYQSIQDCWIDAYWDGWLANNRVDSPKAIQEAVERIMSERWWTN